MKSKPLVIVLIFAITALIMPLPSGAASAPEQALPALPAETSAASSSNYEKAIDLKILGLLATKPDEFELDRVPTRTEGLVMLLRLLGKEYPARQGVCRHPFKDVQPWADNYVGYAYQNGIINGK
ncbi:MAG: S-layer homology domain-containing protein, partial [Acetivibrionales bacterium]